VSAPTPYYQDGHVTIYHGDWRDVLPHIEADVLVTDPPYGHGDLPPRGGAPGKIDRSTAVEIRWDVMDSVWPMLESWDGPAAVFCSARMVGPVWSAMRGENLLAYTKSNPSPFGTSIEPIVVRGVAGPARHVEAYNAANGQVHPTQKPLKVMSWLVGKIPPGVILDPFMGSGSTLRAAKDLGRKAIGIELEERYCKLAADRMRQEGLFG
jgi:DNA modification methylase